MPRIDPPIAPRGPSSRDAERPDAPSDSRNVSVQPIDDPLTRVKALAATPSRYITEANPFTMALWAALNDPAQEVIDRNARAVRYAREAHNSPLDGGEPDERQIVASATPPTVTAIQAVMDATVAAAIMGDSKARDTIATRIEGTAGQRRGDIDPEAEAQRVRVRSTIEQIVRDMADRAGKRPEPIDVTPTAMDDD